MLKTIQNKKGFTLIELLVVIAIIGILSSVVLASLNNARTKARDTRRVADIKQLQLALELYADAHSQEYPDDLVDLVPDYIGTLPRDPNNVDYDYDNLAGAGAACDVGTGSCNGYHLGANLEEETNSILDNDADVCVSDAVAGCSAREFAGTTLSGTENGATGNDCLASSSVTGVFCYDVTH